MKKTKIMFLAAVIGIGAISLPAAAHPVVCQLRASLVDFLHRRYGEVSIGFGLARNGKKVYELMVSDRSWTLIYTTPEGMACMIAAGGAWRQKFRPKENPA